MKQQVIYINWDLSINAKCEILICYALNQYRNITVKEFARYVTIFN